MVEALYHAVRRRNRLERTAGAGAHSAPAVRTDSPPRAGSEVKALCQVQQLVRRVGGGVLHVRRRRREDLEDVVDWAMDPCPALCQRSAEVVARDGVGDVGSGGVVDEGNVAPKVTKATSCAKMSSNK